MYLPDCDATVRMMGGKEFDETLDVNGINLKTCVYVCVCDFVRERVHQLGLVVTIYMQLLCGKER